MRPIAYAVANLVPYYTVQRGVLHTAKYRYPAAYITAIVMPDRSHFGIPIRTSLKVGLI